LICDPPEQSVGRIAEAIGASRASLTTSLRLPKRPPAARTALGPMVIAAVEQYEPADRRIAVDPLAVRLLPPTLALLVRACRWRPLRESMVRATEKKARGIRGGILCRKRYADDQVAAAVEAGIDQVVVLGAGLDTCDWSRSTSRPLTLPGPWPSTVFGSTGRRCSCGRR
jgi:hypothetical protein